MNQGGSQPLELLSAADAAKRADVHVNTITYWVLTGRLSVYATVGARTRLFIAAQVDAAIRNEGSVSSPALDGSPLVTL